MVKYLHNIILVVFLLVCSLSANASNEPTVMCIKMLDGTISRFLLAENPTVKFNAECVLISSKSFSTEYENVDKIYFNEEIPTSLQDEVQQSLPQFGFKFTDGHTVLLSGVDSSSRLAVFTISGMQVMPTVERIDDNIVVDLSAQPEGFYIIKLDNKSFKIYKR